MHKRLAFSLSVLVAMACGRTVPSDVDVNGQPLSVSDAGPACVENGDCGDDEVCLENACVFFGECLRDFHCVTSEGCVDNICRGEWPEFAEVEPISCEINSDCPDRHYCVSNQCQLGVECLMHAHCETGKACVARLCVDAI